MDEEGEGDAKGEKERERDWKGEEWRNKGGEVVEGPAGCG